MPLTLHTSHAWDLTPQQAIDLQRDLSRQVQIAPLAAGVRRVAGVDVGFQDGIGRAAVVVLDFPSLNVVESVVAEAKVDFPYIPGLLSFRELPVLLAAVEQLTGLPDVLLVDGHGYAHPRRFGIASHLGVILDIPTLGCAKSVLIGLYENLEKEAGSCAELRQGQEVIGMAVRTRAGCKPVFVSIGHRIDLASAVRLTLACTCTYRIPQPTRLAHLWAAHQSASHHSEQRQAAV